MEKQKGEVGESDQGGRDHDLTISGSEYATDRLTLPDGSIGRCAD